MIRHDRTGEKVRSKVGEVVLEACLKRARGDWGADTQRAAYNLIELISKWQGHILDEHPEALIGLLLEAISINLPDLPPPERANDPVWFFENVSETTMRNARL